MPREHIGKRGGAWGALAACLVIPLVLAGPALSAKKTAPTSFGVIHAGEYGPDEAIAFGTVTSTKKKCLSNRKVVVRALHPDGPPTKLGTGRTSRNGSWAVTAPLERFTEHGGYSGLALKAKSRAIKKGNDKLVCKGASATGGST